MSSSIKSPLTLRLPFSLANPRVGFCLRRVTRQQLGPGLAGDVRWAYALTRPERAFALDLLRDRRNLWLYRTHQQGACGDFVVVDMAARRPDRRRAAVLELKSSGRLRRGVTGLQLRAAQHAVDEIAGRDGVIPVGHAALLLEGRPEDVLAAL